VVVIETALVCTLKLVLVLPEEIKTLDGTAKEGSEDVRVTAAPLEGAAAFRLTLPEKLLPPATLAVERLSDDSTSGFTLSVSDEVAPANVAEIITCVNVVTGLVVR
jgi:hypothetical protein